MIISDSKRTIELCMRDWHWQGCTGYGPDWSEGFFEPRRSSYDDEIEAYLVDDVDTYIEAALNWKYGRGDCQEDHELSEEEIDDRGVFVKELAVK